MHRYIVKAFRVGAGVEQKTGEFEVAEGGDTDVEADSGEAESSAMPSTLWLSWTMALSRSGLVAKDR